MRAAKDVERRHVHKDEATRFQHASHLGDGARFCLVVQAVEDVERGDEVHRGVGDGQRANGRLDDPPSMGARNAQRGGCQFDADRQAVVREPVEIAARAGAAIEDGKAGSSGKGGVEHLAGVPAKTDKPEVLVFGARGGLEHAFHAEARLYVLAPVIY